jgi:ribokinase
MIRIVVLGDLNLDVHATDPRGAVPGDEVRASVRAVPGGSAGTFARTAAAEGARVTFIGCVGRDAVGDLLLRSLEESGVRAVVGRSDLPSGTILALQQGRERTMVCSRGANDGLTEETVDPAAFEDAQHLHVSGYALLSNAQRAAARRAIGLARDRGATVSVDPPPASLIERHGAEAFRADLEGISWAFPNLAEGRLLSGLQQPDDIADGLARRFSAGALTLGPEGAIAWSGSERDEAKPPVPVFGNPTGAGDTYAAGFVVSFLGGASLAEANARGCALAAEYLQKGAPARAADGRP